MMKGHLEVITGPVMSGKTTLLRKKAKEAAIRGDLCICVKYKKDTRYSSQHISTHDKLFMKAISTETILAIERTLLNYDLILIDEGQFYPDIDRCIMLANQGKKIIISTLSNTFELKPWPGKIQTVILTADLVTQKHGICYNCHEDASFSRRLVNDKNLELIGGVKEYAPSCRGCFHLELNEEMLKKYEERQTRINKLNDLE